MKFLALILSTMLFQISHAVVPDIEIGEPQYEGSGCKPGSVQMTKQKGHLGTILFQNFKLNTRRSASADCRITIPLQVPKNTQVAIGPVSEIKTLVNLPAKGADFKTTTEAYFGNRRAPEKHHETKGPKKGEAPLVNQVVLKDLRWSECGKPATLRVIVNASLENTQRMKTSAQILGLNLLKSGRLYWKSCP